MKNVMVDLETLGSRAGCAILSIGAVAFDPVLGVHLHNGHYRVVTTESCVAAGLHIDQGTVDWWEKQSLEAQKVLVAAGQDGERAGSGTDLIPGVGALPLGAALAEFNTYLTKFGEDVRVWGNGADFDNAVLASAYAAADVPLGWKFYNSRCYRTLKNLLPEIKVRRSGTHHNALDDAITQAEHAVRLLQELNTAAAARATFVALKAALADAGW